MKTWMLALAGLLLMAPAVLGQRDSAERRTLDESVSWGIDLETGKVAVDAYLLYFYDPEQRVLVVNGRAMDEAATEAGAEILPDGSWLMKDGTSLKPLLGEVMVFAGDEPEELRETLRGMPESSVARVQLAGQASAGAERVRWFRSCSQCTACPSGCSNQILFQGGDYKTCGKGGLFSRCRERTGMDYCNPVLEFACSGCTGGLVQVVPVTWWGCAADC